MNDEVNKFIIKKVMNLFVDLMIIADEIQVIYIDGFLTALLKRVVFVFH